MGAVVGGAILVEGIFSYPGVGNLLYLAVTNHDYPLMQALFLVITPQHAGRDLHRRPALRPPRPASPELEHDHHHISTAAGQEGVWGKGFPPDRGGLGGGRRPRGKQSAVPGPLRFLGRALRTLWSNGKARTGLIKQYVPVTSFVRA